jgi:hypothetical protein
MNLLFSQRTAHALQRSLHSYTRQPTHQAPILLTIEQTQSEEPDDGEILISVFSAAATKPESSQLSLAAAKTEAEISSSKS